MVVNGRLYDLNVKAVNMGDVDEGSCVSSALTASPALNLRVVDLSAVYLVYVLQRSAQASMWSKSIETTGHGKHLKALRAKLEAKGGFAHSAFRTFKTLSGHTESGDQRSGDATISQEEFREGCRLLNLGRTPPIMVPRYCRSTCPTLGCLPGCADVI